MSFKSNKSHPHRSLNQNNKYAVTVKHNEPETFENEAIINSDCQLQSIILNTENIVVTESNIIINDLLSCFPEIFDNETEIIQHIKCFIPRQKIISFEHNRLQKAIFNFALPCGNIYGILQKYEGVLHFDMNKYEDIDKWDLCGYQTEDKLLTQFKIDRNKLPTVKLINNAFKNTTPDNESINLKFLEQFLATYPGYFMDEVISKMHTTVKQEIIQRFPCFPWLKSCEEQKLSNERPTKQKLTELQSILQYFAYKSQSQPPIIDASKTCNRRKKWQKQKYEIRNLIRESKDQYDSNVLKEIEKLLLSVERRNKIINSITHIPIESIVGGKLKNRMKFKSNINTIVTKMKRICDENMEKFVIEVDGCVDENSNMNVIFLWRIQMGSNAIGVELDGVNDITKRIHLSSYGTELPVAIGNELFVFMKCKHKINCSKSSQGIIKELNVSVTELTNELTTLKKIVQSKNAELIELQTKNEQLQRQQPMYSFSNVSSTPILSTPISISSVNSLPSVYNLGINPPPLPQIIIPKNFLPTITSSLLLQQYPLNSPVQVQAQMNPNTSTRSSNNNITFDGNDNAQNNIKVTAWMEDWFYKRDTDTQIIITKLQKRLRLPNKKIKALPNRIPPKPPDAFSTCTERNNNISTHNNNQLNNWNNISNNRRNTGIYNNGINNNNQFQSINNIFSHNTYKNTNT